MDNPRGSTLSVTVRSYRTLCMVHRAARRAQWQSRLRRMVAHNRVCRLRMYRSGRFPEYLAPPPLLGAAQAAGVEAIVNNIQLQNRFHVVQVTDWSQVDEILELDGIPVIVQCSADLPQDTIYHICYAARVRMLGIQLI